MKKSESDDLSSTVNNFEINLRVDLVCATCQTMSGNKVLRDFGRDLSFQTLRYCGPLISTFPVLILTAHFRSDLLLGLSAIFSSIYGKILEPLRFNYN